VEELSAYDGADLHAEVERVCSAATHALALV
jgi:hypothetical protein